MIEIERLFTRSRVEDMTEESKKRGISAALLVCLLRTTSRAAIGERAAGTGCGRLAVVEFRISGGGAVCRGQCPGVYGLGIGCYLHCVKVRRNRACL